MLNVHTYTRALCRSACLPICLHACLPGCLSFVWAGVGNCLFAVCPSVLARGFSWGYMCVYNCVCIYIYICAHVRVCMYVSVYMYGTKAHAQADQVLAPP